MNKLTRKFISIFFLSAFLLVSGPAQLIHAAFHDHNFAIPFNKNSSALGTTHTYCVALQLTLPEFFQSDSYILQSITAFNDCFFTYPEPAIPHLYSFKNSDRAPPVLV